jgi:hypothetical protein
VWIYIYIYIYIHKYIYRYGWWSSYKYSRRSGEIRETWERYFYADYYCIFMPFYLLLRICIYRIDSMSPLVVICLSNHHYDHRLGWWSHKYGRRSGDIRERYFYADYYCIFHFYAHAYVYAYTDFMIPLVVICLSIHHHDHRLGWSSHKYCRSSGDIRQRYADYYCNSHFYALLFMTTYMHMNRFMTPLVVI